MISRFTIPLEFMNQNLYPRAAFNLTMNGIAVLRIQQGGSPPT